jgi:hypothetical protein
MRRAEGASRVDARIAEVSAIGACRLWRRGRHARLVIAGAAVATLWACSSHRLVIPEPAPQRVDQRSFAQSVGHKLDVLFMVDDSKSMSPLQAKLGLQLGTFMDLLEDDGRLPDMHVAVVSSSLGGGAWGDVNQCFYHHHPGDDEAKFLQGPGGAGHGSCGMLHPGAKFLDTGDGATTQPNYDGDIRDAFRCIALLGDQGCGFESQFKSVAYALAKAQDPNDADNGGFLRDDAILAIVMVTNEDDCSVDDRSLLLTKNVRSVMDPTGLGSFESYRCNEFGHVCGGKAPPHGYPDPIPAGGVTLEACVSAEDNGPKTDDGVTDPDGGGDPSHGHLWPTVDTFTEIIKSLKPGKLDDILVAAIAGPPTPYRVIPATSQSGTGEIVPNVDHSCTFASNNPAEPENADPAVRISQWVDKFGDNGLFFPICAETLTNAVAGIARKIHQKLPASCMSGNLGWRTLDSGDKVHDCQVSRRTKSAATKAVSELKLDECLPLVTNAAHPESPTNAPCFQLLPSHPSCADRGEASSLFRVCENASCTAPVTSVDETNANISCALE